jgi:hypothetical protein
MCHDLSGLRVCIMALRGLNLKFHYAFLGITRDLQSLTASNKGDSESDVQDQTPDTDDSGAHSYPEAPTGKFFPPGATSSFKRAPIMGNRGLEQRGKKSRTYPPKDTVSAQKVCVIQKGCFLCRYQTLFAVKISDSCVCSVQARSVAILYLFSCQHIPGKILLQCYGTCVWCRMVGFIPFLKSQNIPLNLTC